MLEDTWSVRQNAANALRLHGLKHTLGTAARNTNVGIFRPAGSVGQTNRDSQVVPRTKLAVSDTLYLHAGRHDLKFGGEFAFTTQDIDAHVFEFGVFRFTTDCAVRCANSEHLADLVRAADADALHLRSRELRAFLQDDWRLGRRAPVQRRRAIRPRPRTFALNDFYGRLLDDPAMAGLDRFISRAAAPTRTTFSHASVRPGTPRRRTLIVRGGSGVYVTRNRPWFQLRAMNQAGSSVVRITDPTLLRNYPDISAVLGGRTLDSFIATGGAAAARNA